MRPHTYFSLLLISVCTQLLNNLTKEILIIMINVIPFQANLNSENIRLMSAMLCAALYPNVVQVYINYFCHWNKKLKLV